MSESRLQLEGRHYLSFGEAYNNLQALNNLFLWVCEVSKKIE